MGNNRDDFTEATKRLLKERVGGKCSNPNCSNVTIGPASNPDKAINMGTAAHICAAAPNGPRYDKTMTSEERKSPDNGIWLCNYCADLIDKDPERYTVALLHEWKAQAEEKASNLLNKCEGKDGIYTVNSLYVNAFCQPLFLHKNIKDTKVTLKNLFVMPGYKDCYDDIDSPPRNDLENRIRNFISGDTDFLFISGSGGLGKTTLVSWMNYHYAENDKIGKKLFGDKKLITIRLRDLNKKLISSENGIFPAIKEYLGITGIDELEEKYPDSVMVLDGFDELCMVENLHNPQDLIYDLFRKHIQGFKFIITSRPQYIDKRINITNEYIFLQHFEGPQVLEWLNKYTGKDYCGETIDDKIVEYLSNMDESSFSMICDTPMNLYMLVSKKADSLLVNNNWALYKHIFRNELSETEYNAMFPNIDRHYEHDIIVLRDVLYQISEEIAYIMYKQRNSKLYVNESELREIIDKLSKRLPILERANMKDVTSQCYAICCYWKEYADRGAIEFLHNDIRDFFLAEKIYRDMERLFNRNTPMYDETQKSVANELCELFKFGALDTKVTEFLLLRSMNNREKNEDDFASIEIKRESYCKIISKMTTECAVYKKSFEEQSKITPYELISNVITCTIQVFRHVFEPYIGEEGAFISCGNFSDVKFWFANAFNQIPVTLAYDKKLTLASKWNFSSIDLEGLDLRNIGFCDSLLSNTNFSNTILSGCDFSGCNLSGSDFSDSDAHYASFLNAKLENCDFSGTDLRGTDLPDGFCSTNQDEQVAHLKELNIYGLKINR